MYSEPRVGSEAGGAEAPVEAPVPEGHARSTANRLRSVSEQ